jgi:hypothetical protein
VTVMEKFTKAAHRAALLTLGAVILLIPMSGCRYLGLRDTTINELTTNPQHYDGRTVSVRGTVTNALNLPALKVYSVKDATGEIAVSTNQDPPAAGSMVHIQGRLSTVITIGDRNVGLHIEETRRRISDYFALSGTFIVLLVLLIAACYVFGAYILSRIGAKFAIGTFGDYCVPVYNYVLLCRCAGISPWLLLWLLVPLVDLGFIVYLWGTVAKKLGHDFWLYGLGMFLFGVPAFILAFEDSKQAETEHTVAVTGPSIYCVSGEFEGNSLLVGTEGVIIGRSAGHANLVLSSLEISAMHARVWSDSECRIWVKDLSSSNGTYYCKTEAGQTPEWVEVRDPVTLASGTHFRLGDNVVEFVVS